MASYCMDCSIKMFGKDLRELAVENLVDDEKDDARFTQLCEGCGWTVTDANGKCLHICDHLGHHAPQATKKDT